MSAGRKKTPYSVSSAAICALGALFAAGFAVLAGSLYKVQVTDAADFRSGQMRQSLRRVQVPGRRGRILDRNGAVLADGRPGVCVACYLDEMRRPGSWTNTVNAVEDAADRLAACIGRAREISSSLARRHVRDSPPVPLVLAQNLTDEEQARFAEHAQEFPGLDFLVRDERTYPHGSLAAHLLGYVRREKPDAPPDGSPANYLLPEMRGLEGVERYYDGYLAGTPGEDVLRVDARGYMQARWEGRPARPGPDLTLTIDVKIQRALENALKGKTGAGVAIDPRNGDVLAIASSPAFDPNAFVPRISRDDYFALTNDPRHPLLNRAISGRYAPGSTFKPVTALAALDVRAIDKTVEYDCTGLFSHNGFKLHCWNRWGHGPIALDEAILHSCNTYFCEAGRKAGTNAVVSAARAFGLGSKTGIDLFGENGGTVPDASWKMGRLKEKWHPADLYGMSIGQGFLIATPLQMAVLCAALANGGAVMRPRVASPAAGAAAPAPRSRVPYSAADMATVRNAMRETALRGTGRRIYERRDAEGRATRLAVSCAGKTGTAEIGSGPNKRKNAWTIAFAPFENPSMAVAIVVEDGESGGLTAAPLAHDVFAAAFGETEAEEP